MRAFDYGDENGELVSRADYAQLEAENAELRARVAELEAQIETLEAIISELPDDVRGVE